MKYILSLLILSLAGISLIAQPDPNEGGHGGLNVNSTFGATLLNKTFNNGYEKTRLSYESIKGSPYLNDEAVKGKLVLHDGTVIEDVLIRVDLYTENVIVEQEGKEDMFLDKSNCWEIILPIDGKEVVLKKLNYHEPDRFYEKLYQDEEFIFFKDNYVTYKEGANHGLAKVDPKFKRRKKYYIKHGGKEIKKVKIKDKDVFSGFTKAEVKAFKEYAKTNGIKLNNAESFVKVFEALRGSDKVLKP